MHCFTNKASLETKKLLPFTEAVLYQIVNLLKEFDLIL